MESKESTPRRSRRPGQKANGKEDAEVPPPSQLLILHDTTQADRILLELSGVLDLETVGALRDAAFTAIGTRPALLLIDTTQIGPLDITGIEALNTIGRVAAMVRVRFSVRVGQAEREIFDKTGLNRLITVDPNE